MKDIINKIVDVGIFRIVVAISTLAYYAIASHNLSIEEYSNLRSISIYIDIIPAVIIFGMNGSIPKIIAQGYKIESIKAKAMLYLFAITAIVVLANLCLNNENSIESSIYIYTISIFTAMTQIYTAIVIENGKTRIVSKISALITLVFVLSCLLSFSINYSEYSFLNIRLIYSIVLMLALIYITRTTYNSSARAPIKNKDFISKTYKYGIASVAAILAANLDKIYVKSNHSELEFSAYVTGAFELPLVGLITGAATAVLLQELCKEIERNDIAKAASLFRSISNTTIPIIIPAFFFVHYNSEILLRLVFGKITPETIAVFDSYLLLLLARIILFTPIMIALGMSGTILKRTIVEIAANAILINLISKYFGFQYAGYAIAITTFGYLIPYNMNQICKCMNVQMSDLIPMKKLIFTLIIFSVFYILSYVTMMTLSINIILFLAFYGLYALSIRRMTQ